MGRDQQILTDEPIAFAIDGEDVLGGGGILFQFLAQLKDVVVHGAGGRITIIAPDLIQQPIAGHDLTVARIQEA